MRRYSQPLSFDKELSYIISIDTDRVLDASTLLKENFEITSPNGIFSASVTNIQYLPLESRLKIHLNADDIIGAGPYMVTSCGVLDCYGNNADFAQTLYLEPQRECRLYDISIQSIFFSDSGRFYILQPQKENFETVIRIVNSSHLTKQKKLTLYGEYAEGLSREIFECAVTLDGNTMQEIIHNTVVTDNERIYAVLE